jgi:hypothetical protein
MEDVVARIEEKELQLRRAECHEYEEGGFQDPQATFLVSGKAFWWEGINPNDPPRTILGKRNSPYTQQGSGKRTIWPVVTSFTQQGSEDWTTILANDTESIGLPDSVDGALLAKRLLAHQKEDECIATNVRSWCEQLNEIGSFQGDNNGITPPDHAVDWLLRPKVRLEHNFTILVGRPKDRPYRYLLDEDLPDTLLKTVRWIQRCQISVDRRPNFLPRSVVFQQHGYRPWTFQSHFFELLREWVAQVSVFLP